MEMALLMTRTLNISKAIYNESNLSVTFNEVLILECMKDNKLTKTEVKNILFSDAATVSRSVDKLLEKGMLRKEENSFKYSLTEEGKNLVEEMDEVINSILKENFGDVSKEIFDTIKNLRVLNKKLEQTYE